MNGIPGVIEAINNLDGLTGADLEAAVAAIVTAIEGLDLTADVDVTLDADALVPVFEGLVTELEGIATAINDLDGTLDAQLDGIGNAIQNQTNTLFGVIEYAGLAVYQLNQDLGNAVDGITDAINNFTLDSVVGAIEDLGAGLSVDIGALATAIGSLDSGFGDVVSAIEGVGSELTSLNSTVFNGFLSLAAATYSLGDDVYNGLGAVNQAIYDLNLQGVIDAIDNLAGSELDVNVDDVVNAIENLSATQFFNNLDLITAIDAAAGGIEGSLDGGFGALVDAVVNLPDYTGGLEDITNSLDYIDYSLRDIRDVLETGLNLTAEQIEDVVEAITDLPDYGVKLFQIRNSIDGVASEISNLSGDFTALGNAVGSALGDLSTLLGDESDQTQALISALGSSMADSLANLVLATEEGFGAQAEAITDLQTSMEAALGGIEGVIGDLGDELVGALATAFDELINEIDSSLEDINNSIGNVGSAVSSSGNTVLGGLEALVEQLAANQVELNQQLENLAEAVLEDDRVVIDATGDTFYLDFMDGKRDKIVGFNPNPRRTEGGDELTVYADGHLRNRDLSVANVFGRKEMKKAAKTDVDLIYRRDKDLLYWNADGEDKGLKEITDDGMKIGGRMARIRFDDLPKDKLRAGDFNIVNDPLAGVEPGSII